MSSEVITALPPKSASLLEELCSHANKHTGISQPKDFDRFCRFVIMAHEQDVDLPEAALCGYFEQQGWSQELADAAAKRYKAAGFLLKMYDKVQAGDLEL